MALQRPGPHVAQVKGRETMRRLMSGKLAGALAALMMVGVSVTTAFADPRDFELTNNSGRDIQEIYVAPSNMDDWGDNLIPDGKVLPSGNKVPIAFQRFSEGDCYYDVKVITADGGEGEMNQVNLCETTSVTFN
jgi:hypothetical protein